MAKDLRDSGRKAGIDHGPRRMTHKEMHAAARRAIKIIADNAEMTTETAYALAQDPEAAVEYAAALGKLDESERGIAAEGRGRVGRMEINRPVERVLDLDIAQGADV